MHRLVRLVPAAVLFILIALSPAAQAQEKGSISGRVTDKKTGHALPFV
ncbi:MAG: carboxypeptidase-like regulatory domain-containing protein, partial [Candidatus Eisenbacteria bacterium]